MSLFRNTHLLVWLILCLNTQKYCTIVSVPLSVCHGGRKWSLIHVGTLLEPQRGAGYGLALGRHTELGLGTLDFFFSLVCHLQIPSPHLHPQSLHCVCLSSAPAPVRAENQLVLAEVLGPWWAIARRLCVGTPSPCGPFSFLNSVRSQERNQFLSLHDLCICFIM